MSLFYEKVVDKVGTDVLFGVYSVLKFINVEDDLSLFISTVVASNAVSFLNNKEQIDKNLLSTRSKIFLNNLYTYES